jgi:DtxR family Mn-dependent transcriptional regulator
MTSDLSSSIEDYLETILLLSERDQAVRVTDIAEKLNIAKPSVTAAVNTLKEKGLVTQERYGRVFLTSHGRAHALQIKKRHRILRAFLIEILGVSQETAEKDACLMEHVISPETMQRLIGFLEDSVANKGNCSRAEEA